MRTLAPTLLLVLLTLPGAALALGAYLNYASVRNSYIAMVTQRHAAVATRIAADAEVALSMGLPLAGQDALVRSLTREAEVDPLIASVEVLSSSGSVLHASDGGSPTRPRDPQVQWVVERVKAPIATAFDTVEGVVVVQGNGAALSARLDRLARGIGVAALAAFLVGTALVVAVVFLAVRALRARLERRGTSESGEAVPSEVLPLFDEVDRAHAAVASRLATQRGTL